MTQPNKRSSARALNVRLDSEAYQTLDALSAQTGLTKARLVEDGIRLLTKTRSEASAFYGEDVVDEHFQSVVERDLKRYSTTLKKLAE